jgi:probable phosphoglycerate mutase
MEIYLIRHGETEANLDPTKPPILTENGKKQVNLLANRLKEEKVDLIISSDLERAQLTAKEIQLQNINKPKLEITNELQEIYRLIVGGAPKEGTRPKRFEEDLERANIFWNKLISMNLKKVFVVSHGNIMKFFISKALEIEPEKTKNIVLDPTSISIAEINNEKIQLKSLNNMNHISNKYDKETIYAN